MRFLLLRALLLASAGACALAQLEGMRFANSGGPRDPAGVWWTDSPPSTGIQDSDSYLFSNTDPEGLMSAEFGNYTSYECVPDLTKGKGAYRSILTIRYVYPDGTEETELACEVGTVDLAAGTATWNSSPDECPNDFTANSLTLIPSSLQQSSNQQECP